MIDIYNSFYYQNVCPRFESLTSWREVQYLNQWVGTYFDILINVWRLTLRFSFIIIDVISDVMNAFDSVSFGACGCLARGQHVCESSGSLDTSETPVHCGRRLVRNQRQNSYTLLWRVLFTVRCTKHLPLWGCLSQYVMNYDDV